MKWVLFLLSLLALFAANNVLFWMAGKYDAFTLVAAPISISAAVVLAWLSSKRFAKQTARTSPGLAEILQAPPAVICIFVLLLFSAAGLIKLIDYR